MLVVYVITLIILFLSIFTFKRNGKRENGLVSFVYTWGILYFMCSMLAFIFSYLNIKNNLMSFSLANLIISLITIFFNYKKNGKIAFQKYYLNKKQLISAILIIIVCVAIQAYRYSGFTAVNYKVNDAAYHYKTASDYTNYQKLFDKGYKDDIYTLNRTMFGYYVPCGILMEVLPCPHYVTYNIFNTSVFIMLGLCFYVTCISIKKDDNKKNIITLLITLLYTLAYPLDYVIFGFGYLGSGILATNLIFLTWKFIGDSDSKMLYWLLFLFNLGLFYSYYLFIPAVFLTEGLYVIFNFVKGKYSLKSMFKIGIFTLLVPAIIGFLYFVYNKTGTKSAIGGYSIDGYSYKNLYSNFVLLIPLIIYSIVTKFKKKKIDYCLFFFICELLYIIVTLVFTPSGDVSPYYFYKSYYILWLSVYLLVYELINYKEYTFILRVNFGFIIFIILFAALNVEGLVYKINVNLTNTVTSKELSNVYQFNISNFDEASKIKAGDLKLFTETKKYHKECGIDEKMHKLPYLGTYAQKLWFYADTAFTPTLGAKGESPAEILTKYTQLSEIENDNDVKCILISSDYLKKKNSGYHLNYDDYDVLYENKSGKLLKIKNR